MRPVTKGVVGAGIAIFLTFAACILAPACALVQKTGSQILADCGKPEETIAGNQLVAVVAGLLATDDFQAALDALANDGVTDAQASILCAAQQIASVEVFTPTDGGYVFAAPEAPRFSALQVARAKAYLNTKK